ncbi:MAG: TolC family protein [Bacteroidota bacterium]
MRYSLALVLLIFNISAFSQDSTALENDRVLISLEDIFENAKLNHPIIKQSNLQDRFAEAQLTGAKGMLDPKIESRYAEKNFKDTEYYKKFYNALKIPVWFPIDPKIEAYRNTGQYLDGEEYVSASSDYWQFTAGVSLPIGKGLFIDERRSMIKQARIYSDIAESEKIKLANKTLLEITKSYWDWYFASKQYELMEQSLSIAEELFRRIKIDYSFGEAAVVDTVQAKITYQNRLVDYTQARYDLINSRLKLSIHLWGENDVPLEISEKAQPTIEHSLWVVPEDSSLNTITDWAHKYHPEIQKILAKQKQLEVEEQWNKESLKPELNLSYSFIDAPINIDGLETPQFGENYKLGMDFSFPLYLRKERGKLQKTRIYQESVEFELLQTRQAIAADIRSTYAELETNRLLSEQYESLAQNYNRLFQAEMFNIETGESDLFKLNIQQDKYIEAQIKYLKVLVKFEKLKGQLPFASGLPYLSYLKLYE